MAMTLMMSKTRDLLEDLVKDSSWALSRRTSFHSDDDEFGDFSRSPSGHRTDYIAALSPIANLVVARCSLILGVSVEDLQRSFDEEAPETVKVAAHYARNLIEYCCFRTIELSSQVAGHLSDKSFRRLTFDMMLAWDSPSVATPPASPLAKVDKDRTVGVDAFSRIAPAIPSIADVVSCSNLFNVLTASTGRRLSFANYEKYLSTLNRAIKKMKTQSESSFLADLRFHRGERILDMDGTLTTQPVLEHLGISTWPGRLTLTDHALYFEALKVVTYDKPKIYDLADDLKQSIKPELTGPWGSRLFDKAVMYKSTALSEPVFMEFPELKGHSRRDYWLAIMQEVLYVHRFIRKFQIEGVQKEETLSRAVMGIMRLQTLLELVPSEVIRYESLLTFNLCDQLPGGDRILEALASMMASKGSEHTNRSTSGTGSPSYSVSAMGILSNLGVVSPVLTGERLCIGKLIVGEMTPLEKAVTECATNFKKIEQAQAAVGVVKVDGLDTNLALMKELLHPFSQIGNFLMSVANWDNPVKSSVFCCTSFYVILRGWLGYGLVALLLFVAMFILLTRLINQGRPVDQVKVIAPPSMNTMEQLLAVQNAISQVEELVKNGNIVLLKLRSLLFAVPSQATINSALLALVVMALAVTFLPAKWIFFLMFLEIFTMHSPPRREATERAARRLREWWFSIPAAPVLVERNNEEGM
ncbi:uncharacterized protein LOC122009454 isoform X1 [Zingiber officinale]|uniref:Uncharacterized protein n=2 Tax=Zingiber officinale TaxID=94328 RepID=A0A8J5KEV0_ZINOF|nr:uncharacterized protein LOC122009454 isoform X1 [Zingiber officinale]KAG6487112.1 hypothetical protein ZIOFF_055694 [Zingiber officinale]